MFSRSLWQRRIRAAWKARSVIWLMGVFGRNRRQEVVSAPKVYGFDTGFVCAFRGWRELRPEDVGILWEHFVLNELHAHLQSTRIHYWRSKHGNEIDFVLEPRGRAPIAIECKRSAEDFEPRSLRVFRSRYAGKLNLVVCPDVSGAYDSTFGDLTVRFVDLPHLVESLRGTASSGRSSPV